MKKTLKIVFLGATGLSVCALSYVTYLSYLAPLPVRTNWDIKGGGNLELNFHEPRYYISPSGTIGPAVPFELKGEDQIVISKKGATAPELIDQIESIAFKKNGKIYTLNLSSGTISGFRN